MPLQSEQVMTTRKKMACDLAVGDTVAAALTGGDWQVGLYTVQAIPDNREGQETMTVEFRYDYDGSKPQAQTITYGIRRLEILTVVN